GRKPRSTKSARAPWGAAGRRRASGRTAPARRFRATLIDVRIRNVAVLAPDPVSPFELGVASEVFGTDRSAQGLPRTDFAVVRWQRGPVATTSGFAIDTPHRLDRAEAADLVIVPSWPVAAT